MHEFRAGLRGRASSDITTLMNDPVTGMGGTARQFPPTSWTVLRQAQHASPEERARAVQPFLELYWKPVYFLVRQAWRKSNEEAKDLTQEFFLRVVLEADLLGRYQRERGGFRGFLKAAVLNFLRDQAKAASALKRGGGGPLVSLPADPAAIDAPVDPSLSPEEAFDASWRETVFSKAVALVEKRLRAAGRDRAFDVFRRYDLDPEGPEVSYESLAASLGVSRDAVKDLLKLARSEFRAAVLEVVSEGVEGEDELFREVDELMGR